MGQGIGTSLAAIDFAVVLLGCLGAWEVMSVRGQMPGGRCRSKRSRRVWEKARSSGQCMIMHAWPGLELCRL
jgi:hypothetical protein